MFLQCVCGVLSFQLTIVPIIRVLIMGRMGTPRSTEMERYYKEGLADLLAVDVNIRLNFGRKYWAKFFYLFVSKPYISNFSH